MPDLAPGTREPWAKGWALSVSSVRWQEGLSCLSGRPWADHQVGGGGALGSRLSWRDLSRGGWCREAGMQKEISLLGPTWLSGLKFRGWERGRMGPFHLYPCLLPSLAFSLAFSQKFPDSLPAWILGFPSWVSSLAPPEHHPHPPAPLTHLGDSLSLQSGGEKMLTKSTPVVMGTAALIIVCSLVPGLQEGGWERDEGGGVVRLEPRTGPPNQVLLPLCPGWPPEAPVAHLPDAPGHLAPALQPQVWCPISPLPRSKRHNVCCLMIPKSAGASARQELFSLPLHRGHGGPGSPSK